jgi:hypothetical protein
MDMPEQAEVQTGHPAQDVFSREHEGGSREHEGGAGSRPERGQATSWFVPPIVIPAFLVALVVAYVACS